MSEEKLDLIKKYISLKKDHQQLFFDHQEVKQQNTILKNEISTLKKEIEVLHANKIQFERSFSSKKKRLSTKNKQNQPTTVIDNMRKKKIKRETSPVYEVENIVKHRGKKTNREFLVQWKGYSKEHNSWEREANLSCPKILQEYLEKHQRS